MLRDINEVDEKSYYAPKKFLVLEDDEFDEEALDA